MPVGRAIWFNELQPWNAKVREPILVGRVLFKPAYPEDLNLLSPRSADDLLCPFVVDGDCEDVNESAISIRVGAVVVGRCDHDIRSCADVDGL